MDELSSNTLTRREFLGASAASLAALIAAGCAIGRVPAPESTPVSLAGGWPIGKPGDHGLNAEILGQIHKFRLNTVPSANGFVIVRHGYLVYKEYFQGFTEASYNNIYSVTKSVVSALIGIAQRDGFISDLGQPIVDFFPEIQLDHERKRRITIRHLLTMTSGFSMESDGPGRYLQDFDPVAALWRRPLAHEPGEHAAYDNSATELLSILLTRVTGVSAAEYALRELFEPLGIWSGPESRKPWLQTPPARHTFWSGGRWPGNGLPWRTDSLGNSGAQAGLHLTLREMAKFGWLYLQGGNWEGRQIIPSTFVAESTSPQSEVATVLRCAASGLRMTRYGYLWWLPSLSDQGGGGSSPPAPAGSRSWCFPKRRSSSRWPPRVTRLPVAAGPTHPRSLLRSSFPPSWVRKERR